MSKITKKELKERIGEGDLIVHKKDSTSYLFEENNYRISGDTLYGKGHKKYLEYFTFSEPFEGIIVLPDIETIEHDEFNPVTTTLLIIVIVAPLVLLGLLINAFNELSK
jgi:hypothetical protein